MGSSREQLFSQANLHALLGHLPATALSTRLVKALSDSTSEEDAANRIEELVQSRLADERGEVDAEAPIA